jgi:hypothetical protein
MKELTTPPLSDVIESPYLLGVGEVRRLCEQSPWTKVSTARPAKPIHGGYLPR